jgi:hypothetical protein
VDGFSRRVPSVFAPQLVDDPDVVRPLNASEPAVLELASKDPTLRVSRVFSKDARFVVSLSKNLEVGFFFLFFSKNSFPFGGVY